MKICLKTKKKRDSEICVMRGRIYYYHMSLERKYYYMACDNSYFVELGSGLLTTNKNMNGYNEFSQTLDGSLWEDVTDKFCLQEK